MKGSILGLFFFILLACNSSDSKKTNKESSSLDNLPIPILKSLWTLEDSLSNVESILYHPQRDLFYASSGKDYKPGEDGYISKISPDGKLLEARWVEGLQRPTGMALLKNKLYVADINRLLIIDTDSGNILATLPEPISNAGLNDVVISENGQVFVTGSFVHAIFTVNENALELWLQDEDKLTWANGIEFSNGNLIVGGQLLNQINLETKAISPLKMSAEIVDFDGISKDNKGGFFLSTVENSALWHIDEDGIITRLKKDSGYFSDLQYVQDLKTLFIARGDKTTNKVFVSAMSLQ